MSTAKRSRQRQSEAGAAVSLPPTKKAKTSKDSHVPASGLAFLTDERQRTGEKLNAHLTNGVKDSVTNRPDESQTTILGRPDAGDDVDMGEASEASEPEDSDESDAEDIEEDGIKTQPLTNGTTNHDAESEEDEEFDATEGAQDPSSDSRVAVSTPKIADQAAEEEGGPSFGDMLQASHPETIDVQLAFAERNPQSNALVPANGNRNLQAPSATSLGTVLTQALRTNDKELLESCFQMTDAPSIRSTIQRLQSPLVASLMQKIAERLHKRPGRVGTLMIWIQWSLVAHGGYLAGQPQVMKKLKSLNQVVRERASGLTSLMTLKGKLDLLNAQIELRRSMQAAGRAQFDSEDEEAGVIYVEGEEDESSEDDLSDAEAVETSQRRSKQSTKRPRDVAADGEQSSEAGDDDDIPMVNGISNGVDDDSSEGEGEELIGDGFIDDEAEETSEDEGEASSEDDSEEELDDEDVSASEESEAPPAKQSKSQQRSSLARRR